MLFLSPAFLTHKKLFQHLGEFRAYEGCEHPVMNQEDRNTVGPNGIPDRGNFFKIIMHFVADAETDIYYFGMSFSWQMQTQLFFAEQFKGVCTAEADAEK